MYLLDTVTVSALRQPGRYPGVAAWFASTRPENRFLSSIVLLEIMNGIERLAGRDERAAGVLRAWFGNVRRDYGRRILPIDPDVAVVAGRLCARIGNESFDLLIAGTAIQHDLTVVTRNVSDFAPTGCRVVDPFA